MKRPFLYVLLGLALATGCKNNNDPSLPADPTSFTAQPVASGLTMPIGLRVDNQDCDNGPGFGAGQWLYRRHRAPALLRDYEGTLYVPEGATGKLYSLDVSSFKPGDTPYVASNLSAESIGTFVLAQKLTTNLYNLTLGPGNSLYSTDSGANAIIRRDSKTRVLSVFAKLPGGECDHRRGVHRHRLRRQQFLGERPERVSVHGGLHQDIPRYPVRGGKRV